VTAAFGPGQTPWTAGFFFLPAVPRALAAALTLALWSLAGAWRGLRRDATRVRHVTMSLAAGTAFLIFYRFAGAPTLSLVPWVHQLFSMLAVAAATVMFGVRCGKLFRYIVATTLMCDAAERGRDLPWVHRGSSWQPRLAL
jgi:hypothetical protein